MATVLMLATTGAAEARQGGSRRPAHVGSQASRAGHVLGRAQHGMASYYGREFYGRKMASGRPFNPASNSAASRTLPLGTTARVVNLHNGRSAMVRVEDRGPYVDGRIIDLSPRIAETLQMRHAGVVRVAVIPVSWPH